MTDDPSRYLDACVIHISATTYRQSPRQVERARQLIRDDILTGSGAPPTDDARRIVDWVHGRLRPAASGIMLTRRFGLRYGRCLSVDEALEKRLADCVSHSVLACFLLRNQGIPARLVSERVFTSLDPLAALMALLPHSEVGPFSEGHVWLELFAEGSWQPADAELGIFGMPDWIEKRTARGVPFSADLYGVSVGSFWHFPVVIHLLGPDGQRSHTLSQRYLIDGVRERLGEPGAAQRRALRIWEAGVRHFAEEFDWSRPFPAIRLTLELPRLRRMRRALRSLFHPTAL